ncbi:uncharacterized protein B0H18DRAFT_1045169 [Fomitopsis serialis]|uniref:uncharacterized protein n=1 Tax=Fomitopsis serialis TaxID=139415 RepID=UPI002008654F|nr:uncharacterized protein B0H18DRAFT_1045169 [Neoantrodia serialis]KAH9914479.1 hypothetical protein B0H18DRAFT_1045169 [Neoantrodia serialis]
MHGYRGFRHTLPANGSLIIIATVGENLVYIGLQFAVRYVISCQPVPGLGLNLYILSVFDACAQCFAFRL